MEENITKPLYIPDKPFTYKYCPGSLSEVVGNKKF
jgi:hypothetical protein